MSAPSESSASSAFLFALCQPGAEPALKRELASLQPSWAPAYQRPGLVTFRTERPVSLELALPSVFARAYGRSLGTIAAEDLSALATHVADLPAAVCLHVVERAPEAPDDVVPSARAGKVESHLRALCGAKLAANALAEPGQLVLTVVVGDDPRWLLGLHRHGPLHSAHAGGRTPIALPEDAPSRAYLKIEEAIRTFALPVKAGDTALEIGAAPGGAAYALVRRGVNVIAVDPAAMDPAVLAYRGPRSAEVKHLAMAVAELRREQLPARVEWLLLDVHLAPQVALRAARRLASFHKATLLGAVLTLKLNDWRFAERVPSFLAQAREMGLVDPRAKQLVSHRQELAIVGLTARGVTRV